MVDVNTEGAGKMVHIILCEHGVLNNSMLVTFQKQIHPGRPEVGDVTWEQQAPLSEKAPGPAPQL